MRKGQTLRLYLIWVAIVVTLVGAMWPKGTVTARPAVAPVAVDKQAEFLGKVVLLYDRLRGMVPTLTSDVVLQNAQRLSQENAAFIDRLAYTVLVGKVNSWESAIEQARMLKPANDAERALRDALLSVMEERAFVGKTVAETRPDRLVAEENDRAAVLAKLGFFGRVACDIPGVEAEATRSLVGLLAALGWFSIAFCIGCVTLVFTSIWIFRKPVEPVDESGAREEAALVLGETFAVWVVCLNAMTYGAGEQIGRAHV